MKRYTVLLVVLLAGSCTASVPTPMLIEATPKAHPPTDTPTAAQVTTIPLTEHTLTDVSTAPKIAVSARMPTFAETTPPVSAFFPLGFMGVHAKVDLAQIAADGFNVVHEFRSIQEIDDAQDYLNQAEAAGLQVIQNMPDCRAYDRGFQICEGYSIWSEQEWGEFTSILATHENLVAWYLPDEIDDYAVAANLYKWVKEYDPRQRPVYGNPGTFDLEIIRRFPAFSDFLWGAWYPEFYEMPRAVVTYGTKLDATACQGTDTRWGAILQFFDSADFGGSGGYPTAHELRCDSYQAIIAGATGLWYFAYERGKNLDGLLTELEAIADEIIGTGGLDKVILSPDAPQSITKTVVSGPTQSPSVWGEVYDSIQTLQKEYEGTHLFAVNIATDTVVIEFGNLSEGIVGMEVLFEGRREPVVNGRFRDTFEEADVHIYRVVKDLVYLPLIIKSYSTPALDK